MIDRTASLNRIVLRFLAALILSAVLIAATMRGASVLFRLLMSAPRWIVPWFVLVLSIAGTVAVVSTLRRRAARAVPPRG